jgi:peptidoglycan/LPS O-acetylase OafA/YrhL
MHYRLLDPLRGLAALWVFVFHYRILLSEEFKSSLPGLISIFKMGDRGVPMFFVISGYCLSASAASAIRRSEPPKSFLYRRALRIYPTFWLSIIFITVTHFLFIAYLSASDCDIPGVLASRFRSYDTFFDYFKIISLTQIFDQNFGMWYMRFGHINGAYWTLAIEFQFYLVMTLALFRPKVFPLVIGLVTLASIPAYLHTDLYIATANKGYFLPFWTSFALGILLYELLQRGFTPERVFGRFTTIATTTSIALVAMIATATILFGQSIERLLFAAIFTAVLWFAKPLNDKWSEHIKSADRSPGAFSRGLMLLGAMSYSLYLVHNQISQVLFRLGNHLSLDQGIWLDLAIITATCLICYPFYRFCEAPVLKLCARQRQVPPAMAQPVIAEPAIAGPVILKMPQAVQPEPRPSPIGKRAA